MGKRGELHDGELTRTLIRHDHAIGDLGRRMEGVETGIKGIDNKIDGVGAAIAELKGGRGPGFSEAVRIALMGGSLVAMSAAAVGFLVEARSAPEMMRLKQEIASVQTSVSHREASERAELTEYRRKREEEQSALQRTVDDLKARLGWVARVETAKGGR